MEDNMSEASEALRELAHGEELRAVSSRKLAQSYQARANQETFTADTAEANAKAYRLAAAQLDMMPISTAVAKAMEGAEYIPPTSPFPPTPLRKNKVG